MKIVTTIIEDINFTQFLTNDIEEVRMLVLSFINQEVEYKHYYSYHDIEYEHQVRIFCSDIYDDNCTNSDACILQKFGE